MDEIDEILRMLNAHNYTGTLLIKSTLLPTYCATTNTLYPNLKIIHNPEFLSAKTAVADFENQEHIVLGYTAQSKESTEEIKLFYEELFAYRQAPLIFSITNSISAGLMKLACNSFYATKIQFFTELYLLCEKMEIQFTEVKNLMLKNNWIHPQHTTVPGTDQSISFGGACFPKDISAFAEFMNEMEVPNKVVRAVIDERNAMRNE